MTILNYTTKVPSEQTIGEIQKLLSRHGVLAMMTQYEGRQVSAVAFEMMIKDKKMAFKLPCNWRAVLEIFKNNPSARRSMRLRGGTLEDQAIRTAWRVIKDWMEAQLALVDINMVTIPQIFLPYVIMKGGKTLAEKMDDDPGFLLGDGK